MSTLNFQKKLSVSLFALLHVFFLFVTFARSKSSNNYFSMAKSHLTTQFASRLREAMLAAQFHSPRSNSGVCIHKLSEITGYSVQICRKYLRGEAIPEPIKLMEIAVALHVSPGWLLFGDSKPDQSLLQENIIISKNLLHYIFIKAACIYDNLNST